jgi:hypothetical protein
MVCQVWHDTLSLKKIYFGYWSGFTVINTIAKCITMDMNVMMFMAMFPKYVHIGRNAICSFAYLGIILHSGYYFKELRHYQIWTNQRSMFHKFGHQSITQGNQHRTVELSSVQYISVLNSSVLYCVLHWTLLHSILLYCTGLYWTILYFSLLYCNVLNYTLLFCGLLCSNVLSELVKHRYLWLVQIWSGPDKIWTNHGPLFGLNDGRSRCLWMLKSRPGQIDEM